MTATSNGDTGTTTAFVGAGLIGGSLAAAAIARGERIKVYNRTATKCAPLAEAGATVAESPADAVRGVRRVHVTMTADDAVDAMVEAFGDALEVGAVVVDHSTTLPERTAARAERCAARGIRYLHAPVFMSPEACRKGLGVMLAAGPRDTFEAVERDLAKMTGQLWFVGERPDRAAALKLMGNAMVVTLVAGLADVYTLGKQLDVPPSDALALFERFDPNVIVKGRGAKMAAGDYDTQWTVAMARKDVRLMEAAAGDAPLSALPAVAARLEALIERGDGDRDVGAMSIDAIPDQPTRRAEGATTNP